MVEFINNLEHVKKSLSKLQTTDTISVIIDMNLVSFFSSKNLKTVNDLITDSGNGGYTMLRYMTIFKSHLDNTEYKNDTLFNYLKGYVISYIKNLRNVDGIETSLFVDKKINVVNKELEGVDDLAITAFALILINKNKGL